MEAKIWLTNTKENVYVVSTTCHTEYTYLRGYHKQSQAKQ